MLIGSEDISKLDQYSEGDPRVLELNGALNVGNRGIVEFIEVFKNETEYLHAMITATQEKVIPAPGRHGMVYVDTSIVAHSNEAEWQKFKADHTNEAILDRIVVVKVPYNLRLSEEVKIYQKIIQQLRFPRACRAAYARARIDVRDSVAPRADLEVRSDDQASALQRRGSGREGPHQEDRRAGAEGRHQARRHVGNLDALHHEGARQRAVGQRQRQLHQSDQRARVAHRDDQGSRPARRSRASSISSSCRTRCTRNISTCSKRRSRARSCTPTRSRPSRCSRTISITPRRTSTRPRVRDRNTKEELSPDEGFLKSIEEQIAIIGSAADGFRQEVIAYLWATSRRGEKVSYKSYEPLKEAIEKKLMTSCATSRASLPRRAPATKSRAKSTARW